MKDTLDARKVALDYYQWQVMVCEEAVVRAMLGLWVSEFTPVLVYRCGELGVIGLSAEEDRSTHPAILVTRAQGLAAMVKEMVDE